MYITTTDGFSDLFAHHLVLANVAKQFRQHITAELTSWQLAHPLHGVTGIFVMKNQFRSKFVTITIIMNTVIIAELFLWPSHFRVLYINLW